MDETISRWREELETARDGDGRMNLDVVGELIDALEVELNDNSALREQLADLKAVDVCHECRDESQKVGYRACELCMVRLMNARREQLAESQATVAVLHGLVRNARGYVGLFKSEARAARLLAEIDTALTHPATCPRCGELGPLLEKGRHVIEWWHTVRRSLAIEQPSLDNELEEFEAILIAVEALLKGSDDGDV